MILRTPHLELDAPDMRDAELFVSWLNDPEVVKYSEQRHLKHHPDFQRVYWSMAGENHLIYAIHTADPSAPIGSITARIDRPNNVANVGIMIGDKSVWRKGYGFEAWECVCNYLFIEKKIRKIEAGCMSLNWPMNSICIKSGMRYEATVPGHFLLNGKPTAVNLYGKYSP